MSSGKRKAVVRRKTKEVQGRGNFNVFEPLFAVGLLDNLRTITAAIRKTHI